MKNTQNNMCGIILAGGSGSRLFPMTVTLNKHLIPIYDKPMIYYPLTTLMLAGIRDIAIICRPQDLNHYKELFGTGEQFGINIGYLKQESPEGIPQAYKIAEKFIGNRNVSLILGDNLFLGQGLGRTLRATLDIEGAQIFAFPVRNPERYGVVNIDRNSKEILELNEKPINSTSNLAIPGLYISDCRVIEFAKKIEKSQRGEYEIIDILRQYLKIGEIKLELFSRGIGWMDAGTTETLFAASELVRVLQERQGMKFGSPEEVAWQNGWISDGELDLLINKMPENEYSLYLKNLDTMGKTT